MAILQARRDTVIQTMMISMKKIQIDESRKTIESLQQQRETQVIRFRYYLTLIGESTEKIPNSDQDWKHLEQSFEPVSGDELRLTVSDRIEMQSAEEARTLSASATAIDLVASTLVLLPNLAENVEPMGVGVSLKMDAGNIAQSMNILSAVQRMHAEEANYRGSRATRKVGLMQQLEDRRLQANMTGHEIKGLDKQIEIQQKRLDISQKDVDMQTLQAKNANELEEWYRTKFTDE